MSQFIQHPAESIKLSFAARKAAWLLSLTVLLAAAAVAVVLLVSNGDDNSSSASAPAPVSASYYGGHEEGTAGVASPTVILHSQTQIRRGVIPGPVSTPRPFHGGGFNERYNGGLEEGTAGR